MSRKVLLIAIGTLACLCIGIAGMWLLMNMRKPPQRQVSEATAKLVRVITVTPQEMPLSVQGFGTVRAKTEWSAIPEVSGPIVRLSPQVRAGLYVKKGELLFEIDPRPYRLAVQRIRAQITQLRKEIALLKQQRKNYQATLRIAKGNLTIADEELHRDEALVRKGTISTRELDQRRQWRNQFVNAVQTTTNSLALIEPQIGKTEAAITVARAQLAEAELPLHKTRLVAPFDGQIVTASLALGEVVQAGRKLVTMYDTAAVEIPIAVPLDDLRWLPGLTPEMLRRASRHPHASAALLPSATVHWHSGNENYHWQGRVVRWEAGVDEKTRTMTLVVEVRDPWGSFVPGKHPALQPGMFCEVKIAAGTVPNAVVIPRIALREHQKVFLARHGVLEVRPVQVLRWLREQVILSAGLQPGDKVVISPLSTPIVGMKLRPIEVELPLMPPAATAGQSNGVAVVAKRPGSQQRGR